ncbi:BC1872 family protein [Brevibacillus laterosporus]|uniref:BC1872 family protein n=1 Tax=Brevibacillus laterosporus TaxID=1465 RepID=UPI003D206F29
MTEQQIIVTLATKVMGWVPIPPRPNGPPEVFPAFCFPIYRDIKDGCIVAHKDADGVIDTAHWNPIQNIADAFQVVDKLLSHFYIFELVGVENGWVAIFKLVDVNFIYPKMFDGAGKTREKAICKAAMEVVAYTTVIEGI